jgi:integrase
MALSDIQVRNAAPKERDFKMGDTGGLYILVRSNGSKLWRMKYRKEGREQKLSFGPYPAITLKEARFKRDEARVELGRGGNPVKRKREERIEAEIAAGNTFAEVATEYIEKCAKEGYAEATLKKARWFLDLLKPGIGNEPVSNVSPHELLSALRRIERKGNRESARRARSFASRVFRYGVATLRAEHDPAQPLKGALIAPVVKHYAAITDPKKLGGLLRAIEGFEGSPVTLQALRIAPHVFVRPGELRHATWDEFDFENAVWKIPAGRMKSRRLHQVPLSRQVIALFDELGELRGRQGLVFASLTARNRPMSENTMNAALRRMGFSSDEMTAHGMRATASTLLNESGLWSQDAIERALAHQDSNSVRGIYHRGQHWEERVKMAQWWSDYLDGLKNSRHEIDFAKGDGS